MLSYLFGFIIIILPLFFFYKVILEFFFDRRSLFVYNAKSSLKKEIILITGAFTFIISLWSFLSIEQIVEPQFLPTPSSTIRALWKSAISGELTSNVLISLLRVFIGFSIASLIGVFIGSIAGTFKKFESMIIPVNSAIRYIPPTAFIGLTIIWFGIGELSKIALIFIGIIFYINQMVSDTVKLVPKVYVEAAQTLGANRGEIFRKVILSYSLTEILAVLRVNLGAAWTFLVVAELIAAQQGVGYLMATSQRFLQTPKLFAMILVVGFLGFLSDALIAAIIKHKERWK